jgi:hypothetical protein
VGVQIRFLEKLPGTEALQDHLQRLMDADKLVSPDKEVLGRRLRELGFGCFVARRW